MTKSSPGSGRRIHGWTRDLHLYAGLFLSPFILIFAVSTLVLNHPGKGGAAAEPGAPWTQPVTFDPNAPGTLGQARNILGQLRLTGEIDNVQHNKKAGKLTIPVSKPGELTTVSVDLPSGVATVQRKVEGMAAALVYLHKRPGPHLVMFRGNWIYMAAWSRLADATVYGTFFLTASGLYLWWFFKAERRLGWVLLAAGFLTVCGLVTTIALA
jgi:hypothetical protein